jgi:hypothetical protein
MRKKKAAVHRIPQQSHLLALMIRLCLLPTDTQLLSQ